jgi:hypothetical protein
VKPLVALATLAFVGCANPSRNTPPQPTPVWVRSHNRSPVDVYLLCGSSDPRWLGTVSEKGSESFELPAGEPPCVSGLNFFLVVRKLNRGYWVGPFRANQGDWIHLVIERYAGLSSAQVRYGGW